MFDKSVERRLGRFYLNFPNIKDNIEIYITALKDVLILQTDHRMESDQIECLGWSEHFDVIEFGMFAPFYAIETTEKDGEIVDVKFIKQIVERSNLN